MNFFAKLFGSSARKLMEAEMYAWHLGRKPKVRMVVDIGPRTTKIELVSLDGVLCSGKYGIGCKDMDDAIMMHMRGRRNCCIDERMSEYIKEKMGSAWELDGEFGCEILGRRADRDHAVESFRIDSQELREVALAGVLDQIDEAVTGFLSVHATPEYVADLADRGIVLEGGGAWLPGLDKRLAAVTGLPVRLGCYDWDWQKLRSALALAS